MSHIIYTLQPFNLYTITIFTLCNKMELNTKYKESKENDHPFIVTTMAAIQPSPSRARACRRRCRTLVAPSMLLASESSALEIHENQRRAIDLSNNAFASPILQAASSCIAGQTELRFTLNTDAHSVDDNSWRITKPSSVGQNKSEVIGSGSVESDDAVLASSTCLDVSQEHECWDFEFHDDFGDGLTSPHSESGTWWGIFYILCCAQN